MSFFSNLQSNFLRYTRLKAAIPAFDSDRTVIMNLIKAASLGVIAVACTVITVFTALFAVSEYYEISWINTRYNLFSPSIFLAAGMTRDNQTDLQFTYPINQQNFCSGAGGVFLLIYVHSAPSRVEERHFVRSSWGNSLYHGAFKVKLLFVVGMPSDKSTQTNLTKESEKYGDIIQADFQDSYRNLTLKESAGLQWAAKYCSNADFIMKADDDVIVKTWILLPWLAGIKKTILSPKIPTTNTMEIDPTISTLNHRNLILCHEYESGGVVIREETHKWYVPQEIYPADEYPSYCAGPARIYTAGAVARLVGAKGSSADHLLPMEDVYFTGIVADRAEVTRVNISNLLSMDDPFTYYDQFQILHARSLTRQQILWTHLMVMG